MRIYLSLFMFLLFGCGQPRTLASFASDAGVTGDADAGDACDTSVSCHDDCSTAGATCVATWTAIDYAQCDACYPCQAWSNPDAGTCIVNGSWDGGSDDGGPEYQNNSTKTGIWCADACQRWAQTTTVAHCVPALDTCWARCCHG